MSKSSTNTLTAQVLDYLLRLPNCFAWRNNTTGLFDVKRGVFRPAPKRGVSDIVGVYRGQFFGIEIKTGKDKLRDEQLSFIASIEAANGFVLVVGSFDEFIKLWNAKAAI